MGMHSTYVRGILQGLATEYRLIPFDWKALAKAILKAETYLQFRTWWQDEIVTRRKKVITKERTTEWVTGSGIWLGVERQLQCTDRALSQVRLCCLGAWGKVASPGNALVSSTKVIQTTKEPCTDFLSRLHATVSKDVLQVKVQDLLLRSLAFENTNSKYWKAFTPLKALVHKFHIPTQLTKATVRQWEISSLCRAGSSFTWWY